MRPYVCLLSKDERFRVVRVQEREFVLEKVSTDALGKKLWKSAVLDEGTQTLINFLMREVINPGTKIKLDEVGTPKVRSKK